MQVTQKNLTETNVQLTLLADAELLTAAKNQALESLAKNMRLQGFRQGKAPLNLVEKNADPTALQTEFLDIAMNEMYAQAIVEKKLRPIAQPKVAVKKFVPFDTLELEVEVDIIGEVKLADYKNIKIEKPAVKVSAKEVEEVLENLQTREAEKVDVDRAAKDGDETTIDFKGVDAKTKEAIAGAEGKGYPLVLGSNTFIPGFEPNLIGLKPGEEKTFDITFPKDYGVKALQNRKVTFTVTVSKIQELKKPAVDDTLAAKVGPFKNVAELKDDIKKQLQTEKEHQADRDFTDKLVLEITKKSKAALPKSLIEEQIERILADQRQNIMYRGMTWPEFLESEGKTEDEYRESLREDAETRVKAGIVLSEVAEAEKLTVTNEELEVQIQLLKGRYPDEKMQAELDKPENRRDIVSRILSDKTLMKLKEYAAKATPAKAKK
ncbi:MAG TPA: trigger factor [Candidatus Saccharimonadales bacterium]|nr:trigger factor [Candidatus Saccharimonadales bacterium]